ncbi:hypothetical protein GCM10023322_02600 [Rugosimonospora acidiphila]|uniref:Uncharacterized protein n=1 Tax=Rugosimonospora acidiphila TaxID=556531 RepID=A0ABP9RH00_9ACTN
MGLGVSPYTGNRPRRAYGRLSDRACTANRVDRAGPSGQARAATNATDANRYRLEPGPTARRPLESVKRGSRLRLPTERLS